MPDLAVVVIGRNEGARLVECLKSIRYIGGKIVYVDSGSVDGSTELARQYVDLVIQLDSSRPFTAARARNAGAFAALEAWPTVQNLQFVDGDCVLDKNWIPTAIKFLAENPDVAVVCGRRRERFPQRSIYNRLCDLEWDTPVGPAAACGGDAMVRSAAFRQVNGYQADLIAGEEPEMCGRIRTFGWKVWRLDAEMTQHDAAMLHFSQWWRRSVRSGYAEFDIYLRSRVQGAASHERRQVIRTVFWGLLWPIMTIGGTLLYSWIILGALMLYPLQIIRISYSRGMFVKMSWVYALFVMIAKFAGAQGILTFLWRRLRDRPSQLIEYKAH